MRHLDRIDLQTLRSSVPENIRLGMTMKGFGSAKDSRLDSARDGGTAEDLSLEIETAEDLSPSERRRTPADDARESREKRNYFKVLRKMQRISSWGDFLRRPHHKAFAIMRARDRFIWGASFNCKTQEE